MHQNCCINSKVTGNFLNWWILPTGGVASGRVCVCSLGSRIVFPSLNEKDIGILFLLIDLHGKATNCQSPSESDLRLKLRMLKGKVRRQGSQGKQDNQSNQGNWGNQDNTENIGKQGNLGNQSNQGNWCN